MHPRQRAIAEELRVCPPFKGPEDIQAEIDRRIAFIQRCLQESGLKTLVLGISGGVDSTTTGKLAQRAVEGLRARGREARFIAMRLPYQVQKDEQDAQTALAFIAPDECQTVNIASTVQALAHAVPVLDGLDEATRDFVLGNVKARVRMVVQYTVANATSGLVIGTDHAAEAVMGFFTKYGDGACDLAPLSGLTKQQVRQIAAALGAPQQLVNKVPTADLEDLRPGRPDEEAHGVTYGEIDAFLHGLEVSERAAAIIVSVYDKTAHKRAQPKVP